MNIVLIGCVEFSYMALKHLLTLKDIKIVGIITRKESAFNADFHSLEPLAIEKEIPCFFAKGNDQNDMVEWLTKLKPDVVIELTDGDRAAGAAAAGAAGGRHPPD